MKLKVTKSWCLAMAEKEKGCEIGAGDLAKCLHEQAGQASAFTDDTRMAFGPFIELMRRDVGISREQLAKRADVEAAEIVNIETDLHFTAEPRTVFKLAKFFRVPGKKLLQLSGNAVANDHHLRDEAVRFAARSGSTEKLTPEEREALNFFVKILHEED
jgi:DNA-binding XRE family transcriptional regulator